MPSGTCSANGEPRSPHLFWALTRTHAGTSQTYEAKVDDSGIPWTLTDLDDLTSSGSQTWSLAVCCIRESPPIISRWEEALLCDKVRLVLRVNVVSPSGLNLADPLCDVLGSIKLAWAKKQSSMRSAEIKAAHARAGSSVGPSRLPRWVTPPRRASLFWDPVMKDG